MRDNRSIPPVTVIPVLQYPDLTAAVEWLCEAFGFSERLRIPNHRVQLTVPGRGAVIAVQSDGNVVPAGSSVMVRVDDIDAHFARAAKHGAQVRRVPETHPYGERQYSVVDLAGHVWTFTQSVADVAPDEWGGQLLDASR